MKKLTKLSVNSRMQDAIIDYYMKAVKDNDGKVIYTKQEELIAKCKGYANNVLVYVTDEAGKVFTIDIDVQYLKDFYKEILEIEALESEEFWD